MNNPIDSRNALFKFYWKGLNYAVRYGAIGGCAGAILYPLERLLTSTLREGPSTEIAIAQKR
jgi:hypothetical protein